jgi:RNA polymerase sigma factor (sigma-70 family)
MPALSPAYLSDLPPKLAAQSMFFRVELRAAYKARALQRHDLSRADQDDIVQNAAIAAYLGRATFRAARGTMEQWMSGIVANEVVNFLRVRGRLPWPTPGDAALDPVGKAPNPEESVSWCEIYDVVFDFVPLEERRVVVLHEIEGESLRKIAKMEGISFWSARARYKRGRAKIEQAAEEQKRNGVSLSFAFATAPGPDADVSEPSPELFERTWRALHEELRRRASPDGEPPPSGKRRVDPARVPEHPPSSRPPSRRPPGGSPVVPRLGPLLAVLLLPSHGRDVGCNHPLQEERPAASHPATNPAGLDTAASVARAAEPSDVASALPAPGPVTSPASARPPSGVPTHHNHAAELALMDAGRNALVTGDLAAAVSAFAAHARLYPKALSAGWREELWTKACARYRRAHPQGGEPELDKRCVGRP